MMFFVSLMYCEHRDVSLMTRVQPSQRDTASCDSTFTGSKYALCIQPSVLELYVNAKMCETCISCRIVMYIYISDAKNYNSISISFLCHSDGIIHCHANLLLLYTPIPDC